MTSPTTDRREGLNSSAAIKVPVRAATTANLPILAGLLTVDGIVLAAGNRVLVKNQTNPVNNGIYDADTGNWTRSIDFNGANEALNGTIVNVTEGATDAQTVWRLVATNPVVFGTSQITFTPLLSAPLGTTTNDNAAPGRVGEVISSVLGSGGAVALTTATAKTVTSIVLTAGDWDVFGTVGFLTGLTTSITRFQADFSVTNNTFTTNPAPLDDSRSAIVPGGAAVDFVMPTIRFSLAVTTTVFLVAASTFTVSTLGAFGTIVARRRR